MKSRFDFKSLSLYISFPRSGGDYLTHDISKKISELFGDKVPYDKKYTYLFYPEFGGEIGLLYYFDRKTNSSKSKTYYFGWATCSGDINLDQFEGYLFNEKELTTSYDIAAEQMMKALMLRKWGMI